MKDEARLAASAEWVAHYTQHGLPAVQRGIGRELWRNREGRLAVEGDIARCMEISGDIALTLTLARTLARTLNLTPTLTLTLARTLGLALALALTPGVA